MQTFTAAPRRKGRRLRGDQRKPATDIRRGAETPSPTPFPNRSAIADLRVNGLNILFRWYGHQTLFDFLSQKRTTPAQVVRGDSVVQVSGIKDTTFLTKFQVYFSGLCPEWAYIPNLWIGLYAQMPVKFRINRTLCLGEVRNLAYQERGECLSIFRFYYKFRSSKCTSGRFVSLPACITDEK